MTAGKYIAGSDKDIDFTHGPGEAAMTPPGFFGLLLDELVKTKVRKQYIDMAAEASLVSVGQANKLIMDFLSELGLEHFVDGQPEPERTQLLEALRVMGIRFRRFARYPAEWEAFVKLLGAYDDDEMAW